MSSAKGFIVTLSPDENPGDPGAQVPSPTQPGVTLHERDYNLAVCAFLVDALQRQGCIVRYDPALTYQQRPYLANGDGTQLLLAAAHNAAASSAARGTVFVFCQNGLAFGKQRALMDGVGTALVNARLSTGYGAYVENVVECCAFNGDVCYCEYLYMTNPDDLALMMSPGYPYAAAEATVKGLCAVYGWTYVEPVSPITWHAFTAVAGPHLPLIFYKGASVDSGEMYASSARAGTTLSFDGWRYGEAVIDPTTQAPDARWYHRTGPGYGWVPSAFVSGNAPNSQPEPAP